MISTGRGRHQPEQFRSWLSSPVFHHFALELEQLYLSFTATELALQ